MKSNCKIKWLQIGKILITHTITISRIMSSLNKSVTGRSQKYKLAYDAQ
jgi:hypothetical protein